MISIRQLAFLLFAALGLSIMFWSATDWFELLRGDRMEASFCAINTYWNCDRSTSSPVGAIFRIPIGVFGAFWFWTVLWLGISRPPLRNLVRYLLIAGIAVSAYYAHYLINVLEAGCLTCYATYACVLAVSILGWKSSSLKVSPKLALLSIGGGFLFFLLYTVVQVSNLDKKVPETEFQRWFQSMTTESPPENSPMVSRTEPAKITVVEFSDFACPVCEKASTILFPYLTSQPDIRIISFPFPLDPTCNKAVKENLHPNACQWAKAALCASEQGKYWSAHDEIFAIARRERNLPPVSADLLAMVDKEVFNTCFKDPNTDQKLWDLVRVGMDLNIKSTPTFFVNGKRVEGFINLPRFRRLVEELRKAP